jgi:hypothetical protein
MASTKASDVTARGIPVDFKEQLRRQIGFLESSCREYDSGKRDEAIGLAMPIRDLFHQGGGANSLMTRLGARFTRLLSTASKAPKNNRSGSWFPFVRWELDQQLSILRCRPRFDAAKADHRQLLLGDWWDGEPIYQYGHRKVRRRDLVLAAASDAAGAQVDPSLPADYRWMIDGSGWKLSIRPDNGPEREVTLYDAHLAALRQIAHEVLHSRELTALAAH